MKIVLDCRCACRVRQIAFHVFVTCSLYVRGLNSISELYLAKTILPTPRKNKIQQLGAVLGTREAH